MKISIPHPVFTAAMTKRAGERRIAAGMVTTDVEVEEFARADVEPAFSGPHFSTIVKIDGRLWRRTTINFDEVGKLGLLAGSIDATREISCILSDYASELRLLASTQRDSVLPKPPISLSRNPGSISEVTNYLRRLGDISRRDLVDIDHDAVEVWRGKVREFVSGFALVDGIPYALAQEPLLFVHGDTVSLGTSSIHSLHSNRAIRNRFNLLSGDDDYWRSSLHVYPFGEEAAATELADEVSGRPGGGRAHWFTVECHTTPTSPETILGREACRFAAIQIAYFEQTSARWREVLGPVRHAECLADPSSALGAYSRAADMARCAAEDHQFKEADFGRVRDELDNLVNAARNTPRHDTGDQAVYNWETLCENTNRHLARLDAFPVALQVRPSWRR